MQHKPSLCALPALLWKGDAHEVVAHRIPWETWIKAIDQL